MGIPVEVAAFLGSSPIRMKVEGWTKEKLVQLTRDATRLCLDNNVPIMFVTEDTTRADPEMLRDLYLTAADEGAQAICLSDTVGHATPNGTFKLVSFIKNMLKEAGHEKVRIDWHGHRDRGLSIPNAIAAIEAGADRIHGTGLGIGERCGNTPMDILLVNLKLMGYPGFKDRDLSSLAEYTELVSEMVQIEIPPNYPVMGKDAFRTATGVHAAAIIKAQEKNAHWGDVVYSSVPASHFGKEQVIDVGPLSGISNAKYVLSKLGIDPNEENCRKVLDYAKENQTVLSRDEVAKLF
ncbi:MAG: 2-isopropylmalate synthase [Methanobacteriota archaeon]|nr:MAG: 2-isopropylmalate synthase [Euryarchaeota archaeon]